MQSEALLAQLKHRAEHREVAARLLGQQLQGGKHRLRGGVVGLVKYQHTILLQTAAASSGQIHLQGPPTLRLKAELTSYRHGKQQVAGVMHSL